MQSKNIELIGYACGLAAGDPGCADGPLKLKLRDEFKSIELLSPDASQKDKFQCIAELSERLAKRVSHAVAHKKPFMVYAGDHSSAIGTWSGVAHALQQDFGLIWIDAHLDAHTPETSPSGNIHGMPVASLLGYGHPSLISILSQKPKIKPENLCFIGIRSYEAGEAELIKKRNIKVFYSDDVKERGLDNIFKEAKAHVTKNTSVYGVTIDLDSLEPNDAPGVGTPEPNGLHLVELVEAIKKYCHGDPNLIGAEITEFNPHHDVDNKTLKAILELTHALF